MTRLQIMEQALDCLRRGDGVEVDCRGLTSFDLILLVRTHKCVPGRGVLTFAHYPPEARVWLERENLTFRTELPRAIGPAAYWTAPPAHRQHATKGAAK